MFKNELEIPPIDAVQTDQAFVKYFPRDYDYPTIVFAPFQDNEEHFYCEDIQIDGENVTLWRWRVNDLKIAEIYKDTEGRPHRDGKPAEFYYNASGQLYQLRYMQRGLDHREDGPAIHERNQWGGNGSRWELHWMKEGKHHREDDAPSCYRYEAECGKIEEEIFYYKNNKLHRENNKPAFTALANGKIREQSYHIEGELHRTDGPASINWRGEFIYSPDPSP